MRPEAASAYMAQVNRILSGDHPVAEVPSRSQREMMEQVRLHFVSRDGRKQSVESGTEISPEAGMVAVLNIEGPIMKDDFCGAPGTATIGTWLEDFDKTPEVVGTVLNIDSPGGDGYGMMALAASLGRTRKPTVSIVQHGMACSAAYGIAACTDVVMAASSTDEFGSIGTYVKLANWEKANRENKDFPLEIHTVFATQSTDKNRDFIEALKADPTNLDDPHYDALRKNYLDPFNQAFIDMVKAQRPGAQDTEGVFAGRVFMAPDALKYGLIDNTGATMADAIAKVRELAKPN